MPATFGGARPSLSIANAQFVTDRIAVGGDLAPEFARAREQLQELVSAGITHIADLRDEWTDEQLVRVWAPGVHYLNHRVEDAGQRIPPEWFEQLNDWVTDALADPEAKVLVHCHMGVNRAPSAVFGLLVAQGWRVWDALTVIRGVREVAVIDYADDALDWYLARTGADRYARSGARRSLNRWRERNHIDKHGVIRQIRDTEGGGSSWCVPLARESVAALADLEAASPNPTIGLGIDHEPAELAIRDEVVLWQPGEDGGVVGFGMVVGPPQPTPEGPELVVPVVVLGFDVDPMLPVELLRVVAPDGVELPGEGPTPIRLSDAQVLALNLGLRLIARAAAQEQ